MSSGHVSEHKVNQSIKDSRSKRPFRALFKLYRQRLVSKVVISSIQIHLQMSAIYVHVMKGLNGIGQNQYVSYKL
jgi:hypothetical protein